MGKNYLDPKGVALLWDKIQHRIAFKADTVEGWNKNRLLIAKKDTLYIYTDYVKVQYKGKQVIIPGLKLGDGESLLIDLPFLNNNQISNDDIILYIDEILQHIHNSNIHIDPEDKQNILQHIVNENIHVNAQQKMFWDNKINVYVQDENLIFTRE